MSRRLFGARGIAPLPRVVSVLVAALALVAELVLWGGDGTSRLGGTVPTWVVIGIAVLAYLPLALIPRRALVGFAVMWVFSLICLVVPEYEPSTGLLVALFRVARRCPAGIARLAALACLVPILVLGYNAAAAVNRIRLDAIAFPVVLWLAVYALVWSFGRRVRRAAIREIEHGDELRQAEDETRRRERTQIARELHDSVAHALTGIVLQAAGARSLHQQRQTDPDPQVDAALGAIEGAGAQAMRELHRMLGLMRSGDVPGDVAQHSLAELQELVAATSAAGLDVHVQTVGPPVRVDPSLEHAAFRVIQESLSNAMKHAGPGARVDVIVRWAGDLDISVSTHGGSGARSSLSGGHGLIGVAERVALFGGSFETGRSDDGYVTHASIPLERGAAGGTGRTGESGQTTPT